MSPLPTILLLYGLGLTASMQVGLVGPIAPPLRAGFGLSQAGFGLVASLITAAGAVLAIPAGVWAARFGLRRTVLLGAVAMAIGSTLFATAHGAGDLYTGRLVTSAGYLLVVVGAPSWMTRLGGPRTVAMAMSLWGTFVPVGIALGTWTSAVVADIYGWRAAVAACGLPAALLCLPLLHATGPTREPTADSLAATALRVLHAPAARRVALLFALFAGATASAVAFLPAVLADRLGIGIGPAAAAIGVVTLAGNLVGSSVAGLVLTRGGSGRGLLAGGLILMAVTVAAAFSSTQLAVSLAVLLAFNLGQGAVAGTCFALLPPMAARGLPMPALQGLLAQFAEIAVVLTPPMAGAAIDVGGWVAAAWMLAIVYLLGLGLLPRR